MLDVLKTAAIAYVLAFSAAFAGILALAFLHNFESQRERIAFVAKCSIMAAMAIAPACMIPMAFGLLFWGVAMLFS